MKSTTTFQRLVIACLLLSFTTLRAQFPSFPPANVTNVQDRDQMVWQLGITFPTLPPKLQDPNAPPNTYPVSPTAPENNWRDAYGHTITRSGFGLWNNYDDVPAALLPAGADGTTLGGPEAWRVGSYTPIDLLKMKNGTVISSPSQWYNERRPEIFKDVREEFWGVVPDASRLPGVSFSTVTTTGTTTGTGGGYEFKQKVITGNIDISGYPEVRNVPRITATLRTPLNATGPVPVIIVFGGSTNTYFNYVAPKGWGICVFSQNALQPDNGVGLTSYLIGLVNKGNWRQPNDWGALAAWGWGVSKLIDYFETDSDVDAKKVGVTGHSRYGKATIVAMAYDPRVAIGYPSCSGSLGVKMNRRHWGQDVENSGWDQEYHWMAGNFFKWHGPLNQGSYLPRKIELCPVDAHSLLALCAPRPVFTNGGTGDSWSDPYGTYLAEVAATPVYKLLGYEGMVMPDEKPGVDVGYIEGQLGFRYHNGGHTDAPDWPAFLQFAEKYFNNTKPQIVAGQSVSVSENTADEVIAGTITATDADAGATLKKWQITGGDGASIFDIDEATGDVMLKKGTSLDFESKTSYKLMVTVSDGALTSDQVMVTVNVNNENDNSPRVKPAQSFGTNRFIADNTVIGVVTAMDIDDSNQPGFTRFQDWLITGGTGASIFAINSVTGQIRVRNALQLILDNRSTYTLQVKASDGKYISAQQLVTISVTNKIAVCHYGRTINITLSEAIIHILHGDYLGECGQNNQVNANDNSIVSGLDLNVNKNKIVVYPNPVQNEINISLGRNEQRIRKIDLIDMSGKVLRQYQINQKATLTIPRGNLKPGIYLLRMQGDQVSSHKIMVK